MTFGYPNAYTCDHFQDVRSLSLQPDFADYVREPFKPLGLCLNFWQPELKAGSERRFAVMMVNDDNETKQGRLVVSLERAGGSELARREVSFSLPGLGQRTYEVAFAVPQAEGPCLLQAAACAAGGAEPTLSRRRVTLVNESGSRASSPNTPEVSPERGTIRSRASRHSMR